MKKDMLSKILVMGIIVLFVGICIQPAFANIMENQPPDAPTITGPIEGYVGVEYIFNFSTTDPEGNDVYYYIDWDDGNVHEWIGPFPSGYKISIFHIWSEPGTYLIQAKAKDYDGYESNWSEPFQIIIFDNTIPTAPDIYGEFYGKIGTEYYYDFTAIDEDGDDIIEYYVDWGDDTWPDTITGPFKSGETATASHTYTIGGDFIIRAKAKDIKGAFGPEGTFGVTMPRDKAINNPLECYQEIITLIIGSYLYINSTGSGLFQEYKISGGPRHWMTIRGFRKPFFYFKETEVMYINASRFICIHKGGSPGYPEVIGIAFGNIEWNK